MFNLLFCDFGGDQYVRTVSSIFPSHTYRLMELQPRETFLPVYCGTPCEQLGIPSSDVSIRRSFFSDSRSLLRPPMTLNTPLLNSISQSNIRNLKTHHHPQILNVQHLIVRPIHFPQSSFRLSVTWSWQIMFAFLMATDMRDGGQLSR
jgi:hypothetical protein